MTIPWKPAIDNDNQPIYTAIVLALAEDKATGRLKPGDRLPTQRDLADQLGVSLGTVTRAFNEAARRGLVKTEGRRGAFVAADQARISALDALIKPQGELLNQGVGLPMIDFGVDMPLYGCDPDLGETLAELSQDPGVNLLLHYPPGRGLERHRQAGAAWMRQLGLEINSDSVMVTGGGQNGIHLILTTLTQPGDLIMAERLTYPGLIASAEQLKLKVIGLDMDDHGLRPDSVERTVRSSGARVLYCIPDLHNPLGSVMPEDRRRQLALIAEKYKVAIIEDAIHRPLLVDPPSPLAGLAPDHTFHILSASKAVAAGLRIGFIAAPARWSAGLLQTAHSINLMISPLTAELLTRWLENGRAEETITRKREEARGRRELADEIITGLDLKGRRECYYAWLDLPPEIDEAKLTMAAYQRGVIVSPSHVFNVGRDRTSNGLRLCLGTPPDRRVLATGLEVLADLIRQGGGLDRAII